MEIFIIPLIALAIWILQYIFRTPEDEAPQRRPRQPGQPGMNRPGQQRPRRQVTDLDRYLEESRRRRQGGENPPVLVEADPDQPTHGELMERERRAASPKLAQRPPARRPSQPPAPQREPQRRPVVVPQSPHPVVVEVTPAAVPVVLPVELAPELRQGGKIETRRSRVEPQTPRQLKTAAAHPALAEVAKLLRSPRTAAAAVILREILDVPAARRGPRF